MAFLCLPRYHRHLALRYSSIFIIVMLVCAILQPARGSLFQAIDQKGTRRHFCKSRCIGKTTVPGLLSEMVDHPFSLRLSCCLQCTSQNLLVMVCLGSSVNFYSISGRPLVVSVCTGYQCRAAADWSQHLLFSDKIVNIVVR